MTDDLTAISKAGLEALETLHKMLLDDDVSDAARVSADKAFARPFFTEGRC